MSQSIQQRGSNIGKLLLQMVLGALFGAGVMFLALYALDLRAVGKLEPDVLTAIAVGVIYCLMGVFVGFGVLFPKPGAKLLNVESEEELVDERGMLGWSSVAMFLIGFTPMVLAFASPGLRILTPTAAAIGFVICIIGQAWIAYVTRNDADEFAQRISTDSGTTFLMLMSLVFGTWAALAHLGFTPMFSGLAFVSGTLALFLLAIFWQSGKRGLLMPR